jgi:hypothetical protein
VSQVSSPVIPSPDGKHLAFLRYNFGNNAWVLEGF